MEKIIERFNNFVAQMADEVAESKTPEETQKEWDKKIEAEEKIMEAEIEAFIQNENKLLAEEHQESEDALKKQEEEDEAAQKEKDKAAQEEEEEKEEKEEEKIEQKSSFTNDFKEYLSAGLNDDEIAKKFKETDLIEIAKTFGVEMSKKGTKVSKVTIIKNLLEKEVSL